MEDKDIEQKLKEGADNIEVRDFSLVWNDIESKIVPPKKKRFHWVPLVATAASIVFMGSIIIPIALQQNDNSSGANQSSNSSAQVYFSDELLLLETTTEEFFNRLNLSEINIVDVNDYVVSSAYLFKTPEQIVKGGRIELTDDLDLATFYLAVDFYDESIKIDKLLNIQYDSNYAVNDATVQYRIKESYPEDGIYIYDIKANFQSVNYFMEYTCFTEDIKPFLNEFFK